MLYLLVKSLNSYENKCTYSFNRAFPIKSHECPTIELTFKILSLSASSAGFSWRPLWSTKLSTLGSGYCDEHFWCEDISSRAFFRREQVSCRRISSSAFPSTRSSDGKNFYENYKLSISHQLLPHTFHELIFLLKLNIGHGFFNIFCSKISVKLLQMFHILKGKLFRSQL